MIQESSKPDLLQEAKIYAQVDLRKIGKFKSHIVRPKKFMQNQWNSTWNCAFALSFREAEQLERGYHAKPASRPNSDRNDLPTFRSSGAVIEDGEIVHAKTAQNRKKIRHGSMVVVLWLCQQLNLIHSNCRNLMKFVYLVFRTSPTSRHCHAFSWDWRI